MRILTVLFIAFCFFSCGSDTGNTKTTNGNNTKKPEVPRPPQDVIDDFVADLDQMTIASQTIENQIRSGRNNSGAEEAEYELFERQAEVDSLNMEKLSGMLKTHGWIAKSVYGQKASAQALSILNKASSDFQVYFLPMLTESFAINEVPPAGYAEIYDKVMVAQGKKQLYGTQLSFNEAEGKNTVHPIEDEGNIDNRRRMVGLPPMTEYWANFGIVYPQGESSTDH